MNRWVRVAMGALVTTALVLAGIWILRRVPVVGGFVDTAISG